MSVQSALTDTGHPLGEPERGLLLPPPPPAPASVGRSRLAVTLYAVAGAITVLWLMNMANGMPESADDEVAYRMGYLLGPLILSVPLALIGLTVQLTTKQRRARTAENEAAARHAAWVGCHRVWQAVRLCRRCRVAFFPEGAVGPHFPASQAIEVAQLATWVTGTAAQAFGVPEPAGPR
ncbi:hypothetical protein [Kitasatospora sp. NE20-6]|uniref:hypothetical protein n=1 Tax=Kitasatospora sp. NE20-6 TaxID=2859066 RepID=UPI0038B2EC5F